MWGTGAKPQERRARNPFLLKQWPPSGPCCRKKEPVICGFVCALPMDYGQSVFFRERFWAALETQRAPPWMSVPNQIPISAILKVGN